MKNQGSYDVYEASNKASAPKTTISKPEKSKKPVQLKSVKKLHSIDEVSTANSLMDTYLNSTAQFEPIEAVPKPFKCAASSINSEGSIKAANKKADDTFSGNFLDEMPDTEATNEGYLNDSLNSVDSSLSATTVNSRKPASVASSSKAPKSKQQPKASEATYDMLFEMSPPSKSKADISAQSSGNVNEKESKKTANNNSSSKIEESNSSQNSHSQASDKKVEKPNNAKPPKVVTIVNQSSSKNDRQDRMPMNTGVRNEVDDDEEEYDDDMMEEEYEARRQQTRRQGSYSTYDKSHVSAAGAKKKKPEKKKSVFSRLFQGMMPKKKTKKEDDLEDLENEEDDQIEEEVRHVRQGRTEEIIEEDEEEEEEEREDRNEPIYEALDDIGPRGSVGSDAGSAVSKVLYTNAMINQQKLKQSVPFSSIISEKRPSHIPKPLEVAVNNFDRNRSKSIHTSISQPQLTTVSKTVESRPSIDFGIRRENHSTDSKSAKKDHEILNSGKTIIEQKRRTMREIFSTLDHNPSKYKLKEKRKKKSNSESAVKHKEKEPKFKLYKGLSIVYGMFILLVGIFLTLDNYAGKLGRSRVFFTVIFGLTNLVSISWLIYLFVDVNAYRRKVNKLEPKSAVYDNEIYQIDRDKDGKITFKSTTNGEDYMTRKQALASGNPNERGKRDDYEPRHQKDFDKLLDVNGSQFQGYLFDTHEPYNMYLRAGIGIFCLITLLQSGIDMLEAVENLLVDPAKIECTIDINEAINAGMQFLFSGLQFLFIFLRSDIVIFNRQALASILTIHVAVNNLVIWVKTILIETLNEFYEHVLEENLELIEKYEHKSNHSAARSALFGVNMFNGTLTADLSRAFTLDQTPSAEYDCYDGSVMKLKPFLIGFKSYLYPATIEFSITCATIFLIMWTKIGKRHHGYQLPPPKLEVADHGPLNMPFSNLYVMLDCNKTARGLFGGLFVLVGTILSFIVFQVYQSSDKTISNLISQITELALVFISLAITCIAFIIVRKCYAESKAPHMNIFDITLEIFSLFGVYAFNINSLIGIIYSMLETSKAGSDLQYNYEEYMDYIGTLQNKSVLLHSVRVDMRSAVQDNSAKSDGIAVAVAVLSIVQATLQTLFILECLRRFARNKQFVTKPGRELIVLLLLTNLSMWFYDTFSAKRFYTKSTVINHFGILKWSIINAFSSPIAIFYRFHSSVCLSDIWYGLFYTEAEEEHHGDGNSSIQSHHH